MTRIELFKNNEEFIEKELSIKDWEKFKKGWEVIKDSPDQKEKELVFKSLVEEVLYFSDTENLNEVIHVNVEKWQDSNENLDVFLSKLIKIIYKYGKNIIEMPVEYNNIEFLLKTDLLDTEDNIYLLDIFYISLKYYFKEIGKVIEKITDSYRMTE